MQSTKISQIYYHDHQSYQICKVSQCRLKSIGGTGQTLGSGIIKMYFKHPHMSSKGPSSSVLPDLFAGSLLRLHRARHSC